MADEPQVVAERERIFKHFDANGDGKVSAAELGDALNKIGSVTTDDVKHMMSEIDTDGDGFISYKEFMAFASANPDTLKKVAKIF
ncbi:hypothetical protein I3843_03G065200 [Carya illinoinensis]|uniref:EF-hand domain-containing protein n=1 Tax=Carya illinoinensis TaxID=32201 RepID=A0A8T1R074_CARIL|nr:polcalcin Bet v 4 [Carya illinoinensis]KAG2715113.1 hypothetical protein I3760_03G062300 [Carya illinoinensis]KAG6659919.1 hypothetical protein CIPAW_03G069700 [Carya illinoinensis]KAG6720480.1 hypothetical protein I3842_03G064800 [Carya illinoinensis]KAG7986124.1 hypothetical protein I3843_03G065200 [Carya illinoinensis]